MGCQTLQAMMKTQVLMLVAAWLVATLCITLSQAGAGHVSKRDVKSRYDDGGDGDLSKVELDMMGEDYEDAKRLRCHHCYRSVHGEACVKLEFGKIEVQDCMNDEPFCMVERFMTDEKLTTFTRRCSRECTAGCQSAGDNYKLEYCYSCCEEDFCNRDNGAGDTGLRAPRAILLTVVIYALSVSHALGWV